MPTRETHVVRFYRKDDSGEIDPDVWVDVEVIDKLVFKGGKGLSYQKVIVDLDYQDGNNPERQTTSLRIENPDDESQFIDIDLNRRFTVHFFKQDKWQKRFRVFDNSSGNSRRETHTKRVYHNGIDDQFLSGDEGRGKQPPRDPDEYLNAIQQSNDQDQDQFLEVEVPDVLSATHGKGPTWQKTKIVLKHGDDPLMKNPLVPLKD